ncbi:MAG: phosphate/phosphite/phosphonate ABC transporter substrate-binding protein [Desulfobulbaceae bacterium]|nr:phosphate/phosphite/phosphonate ABC transporter substrate-binding protein [Desulfobulbaceae bacterium]
MEKIKQLLLLVLMAFAICACSADSENQSPEEPTLLRISILPDESKDKLLERYTPLCEYLSAELGIPYRLILVKTYDELLELFHRKEIDLAYFGGYTFIKAHLRDQAVPLVMRNVDTRFTSYFLTRTDNPRRSLTEFKGLIFTFGSDLSTSGHLMPRFFLKKMGIIPEKFFTKTLYSGKHDQTAYWIRDGQADLGVANNLVIDQMYKDGRLSRQDVRIIEETPPYPDYVWALRPLNNKAFEIKLRNAFLSLSKINEAQDQILKGVIAESFLPAGVNDFAKLMEIMNDLNFSEKK